MGRVSAGRQPDEVDEKAKRSVVTKRQATPLEVGDVAPDFTLEDGAGVQHSLSSLRGKKVLLSFYRFAACPFSLMRIENMQKQYDMLKRAGIAIVCVYKSTPTMVANFASETSNVIALSDRRGSVYKSYQVNQSSRIACRYQVEAFAHYPKYRPYVNWLVGLKDTHFAGMKISPGRDINGIYVFCFMFRFFLQTAHCRSGLSDRRGRRHS